MSEITNLAPKLVWEQFEALSRVPRPSKKEEKIREFLVQFATTHHLDHEVDAEGNVVIRAGATAGFEDRPAVILQSHMDMVCEKNTGVAFDFERDPIRMKIVDGWVMAEGTTLGADDGIGMAAAMAALIDPSLEHGPLEALFTVDEETGLTGAFGLGEGMLTGKYLLNLDSEDEGEIFIGCAGGVDTVATFRYRAEAAPVGHVCYQVAVSDLLGGHSGDDIDKGRMNSNKLIARLLWEATERFKVRLSRFDGGNLRNAIPREAQAIFAVPVVSRGEFEAFYATFAAGLQAEAKFREPKFKMSLEEASGSSAGSAGYDFTGQAGAAGAFGEAEGFAGSSVMVIDFEAQRRLLQALVGLPNGVIEMSMAMPGLVETSSNLASVKFESDDRIVVVTSQRSDSESGKEYAKEAIGAVFALAGAEVVHSDGYPGWAPNPQSNLLQITVSSYERLFGVAPKVRAIHAGLECGLFLEKFPQLEMVSFGPTLRGVHSPDERLEISTVAKFWDLMVEILKTVR